ncbi:caspase family protein [Gammaproteobacteria bacterium]|nr:caspase family protein [Gammaproteobacteria bacterium]
MIYHKYLLYGILALFVSVSEIQAEQVSVETLECNGDVGFSSFEESRLYKIQDGGCENPYNPEEPLQQILLRSNSGVTRYQVLWITRTEAGNVMQQIRENKGIRQDFLQQRNKIKIQVDQGDDTSSTPERSKSSTSQSATAADEQRTITIELLDPLLSRSVSHLFIDPKLPERVIVGQVSAASGLISFSVNGRPVTPNQKGIFRASVPITREKTQIQLVAIDQNGQKATRDFWMMTLNPDDPESAPLINKQEQFGKYHALLIGINEYPDLPNLETALNDVEKIESILNKKYRFTTHKLINPKRYEVLSMMNRLRKELNDSDSLMVYYAGHGVYDKQNNRGHWLPADAEQDNPANWISTVDITDHINRMSARHIMVVADSCYSGALTRSVNGQLDPGMTAQAQNQWYRTISKSPSRTVLTSGGLQPVMDGGGGGHSIFARAFIQALNDNSAVIDGTRFAQSIKNSVSDRARQFGIDQNPEYAELKKTGHQLGDFLLVSLEREELPRTPNR